MGVVRLCLCFISLFVTGLAANAAPPRPGADTVVIFAVDVSGSAGYSVSPSCLNQMVQPPALQYPDGILQCEIAAVVKMNEEAINDPSVGHVGIVVYGLEARRALVDSNVSAPNRYLTTPDASSAAGRDIEVVARSIRTGSVHRFGIFYMGLGSYADLGLRESCNLARSSPMPNKMVVMISDGQTSSPASALGSCPFVKVNTVVLPRAGSFPGCSTGFGYVSRATGGTCAELTPQEIASVSLPPTTAFTVARQHIGSLHSELGSIAWDVNAGEAVVGTSWIADPGGSATPLVRSFAWRFNRLGQVQELGTLGGGNNETDARSINDAGQVAGYSFFRDPGGITSQGFRITPLDANGDGKPETWFQDLNADGINDLMVPIPSLGGPLSAVFDMNQAGQVVGQSTIYPSSVPGYRDIAHAFLWSPETGLVDLGTPGGRASRAIAINDRGVVFGVGNDAAGAERYFRIVPLDASGDGAPDTWYRDADANGINDLMTLVTLALPEGATGSAVMKMNNAGELAGYVLSSPTTSQPATWAADGSVIGIGTFGGSTGIANDINDRGQVAGHAMTTADADSHPFIWTRFKGKVDLGALSDSTGLVQGINGLGDRVVGYSPTDAGRNLATIWRITNTATGGSLVDPDTGVSLAFTSVTQPGYTDVIEVHPPDPGHPPEPGVPVPNFEFNGVYYNITTTATFTGSVQVCIPWPQYPVPTLRHLVNNVWVSVFSSYDSYSNRVCGIVGSFSWFTVELNRHAPLADAGPDRVLTCDSSGGARVQLDGSASSDPDGDALSYAWTGPFGTASGVAPTVTLPLGDSAVSLVVSDGTNSSHASDSSVRVIAGVQGLSPPLAPLVPAESELVTPDTALKSGRTLPLRLRLSCGATLLTDAEVPAPVLESVQRIDEAMDLAVVDLDAGLANSGTDLFRYADSEWIYNLSTKGFAPGTYRVVIRMPDGMGYETAIVLR